MSDAALGYGSLFQTGDGGSPEIWSTVAEVTNISPPGVARDSVDTSHENGPNEWRESIPGLKTPGEMSIEMNFVPGGDAYADLFAELSDQLIRNRRIVFPDGEVMGFRAFLTGLESEVPVDAQMKATATFQLSGAVDPIV